MTLGLALIGSSLPVLALAHVRGVRDRRGTARLIALAAWALCLSGAWLFAQGAIR
jgi:hypothetical protein